MTTPASSTADEPILNLPELNGDEGLYVAPAVIVTPNRMTVAGDTISLAGTTLVRWDIVERYEDLKCYWGGWGILVLGFLFFLVWSPGALGCWVFGVMLIWHGRKQGVFDVIITLNQGGNNVVCYKRWIGSDSPPHWDRCGFPDGSSQNEARCRAYYLGRDRAKDIAEAIGKAIGMQQTPSRNS